MFQESVLRRGKALTGTLGYASNCFPENEGFRDGQKPL